MQKRKKTFLSVFCFSNAFYSVERADGIWNKLLQRVCRTHSFIFVFASFLAFQGHDISWASTFIVKVFQVLYVCVLWFAEMKCYRRVNLLSCERLRDDFSIRYAVFMPSFSCKEAKNNLCFQGVERKREVVCCFLW